MATPTYLDDSGNPITTSPQASASKTYLDDNGNPASLGRGGSTPNTKQETPGFFGTLANDIGGIPHAISNAYHTVAPYPEDGNIRSDAFHQLADPNLNLIRQGARETMQPGQWLAGPVHVAEGLTPGIGPMAHQAANDFSAGHYGAGAARMLEIAGPKMFRDSTAPPPLNLAEGDIPTPGVGSRMLSAIKTAAPDAGKGLAKVGAGGLIDYAMPDGASRTAAIVGTAPLIRSGARQIGRGVSAGMDEFRGARFGPELAPKGSAHTAPAVSTAADVAPLHWVEPPPEAGLNWVEPPAYDPSVRPLYHTEAPWDNPTGPTIDQLHHTASAPPPVDATVNPIASPSGTTGSGVTFGKSYAKPSVGPTSINAAPRVTPGAIPELMRQQRLNAPPTPVQPAIITPAGITSASPRLAGGIESAPPPVPTEPPTFANGGIKNNVRRK